MTFAYLEAPILSPSSGSGNEDPSSTQFQFPLLTILKFMLFFIRLFLDQFLLLTSFDLVTKSEYCSFSMHEPCPFSIDFWASFRSFQMTSDNCTKHVWNDMFFQDHGPPLNFYCILLNSYSIFFTSMHQPLVMHFFNLDTWWKMFDMLN